MPHSIAIPYPAGSMQSEMPSPALSPSAGTDTDTSAATPADCAEVHAQVPPDTGLNRGLAADPYAEPDVGWHWLPNELLAHIGSFLPWPDLDALGQSHHRARDALTYRTVLSRIAWRTASVTNLSTLVRTLGELGSPLLTGPQRADGLCALAARLPSLHDGMVPGACHALMKAIEALPAPLRAAPLIGVLEGLACRRAPILDGSGARRLRAAAHGLPPGSRAYAHVATVRLACLMHNAMPTVDQWVETALALAAPDRGVLLAEIVRRFGFGDASPTDPRVRLYMQACASLRLPDGEPSWPEHGDVLKAMAEWLDKGWTGHALWDFAAAQALWHDLLDAAGRLPTDIALDVMVALAGDGCLCRGNGAAQRWQPLWQAGLRFRADLSHQARWLATLGGSTRAAEAEGAWDLVHDSAQALPARERAAVLARLAHGVGAAANAAQRRARWHVLFRQTVEALPPECRAEPLAHLADHLQTEAAPLADERWGALLDALPPLSRDAQVRVLRECVDEGTAERYWPAYQASVMQLPVDARGRGLTELADRLVHLDSYPTRARAWWDIAAAVAALSAEQQCDPWRLLQRRAGAIFRSDAQAARRARGALAELLAGQPAAARQQSLLVATWNADAERCGWILEQVRGLPMALRAEVLTAVARRPSEPSRFGWISGWDAGRRMAVWVDLLVAVQELPTHYRGSPLHQLAELLATLPPTARLRARRHFVALLRGVPHSDIPAGFTPPEPFGEAAMVHRALKRAWQAEVASIASKRARPNAPAPGAAS